MPAPEGNDYAVGNPGGGAPEGNQNAVGNDGGGAPEGNANALKHGALADPSNLYSHLNEQETRWIESLVDGYLQFAPFDGDDPRRERLTRYCIMAYQEWAAADVVLKEGLTVSKQVGVNDDGEPVLVDDIHHLVERELALNAKVRQGLKNLGCLPGPTEGEET